ncbi:unnamed protein product [Prunus armeniaca]|uniref:Uncharacterized protein n=1 Tax=Prunus armeniaca TaxID=36596 RepID=A0A6J5V547_PRUAR|nr:unnamed protein product [Prunus armeniaca]
MALSWVLPTTLLFALALANIQLSTCQVVKAKVTCLDCHQNTDFSEKDGSFETKLPLGNSKSPMNCLARILGGPDQLYASRKVMASEIVKTQEPNSYTISTPLGFTTSCPLNIKEAACKAMNKFGSSKTVNLPVPPEWGLAPSSYYVPFIPIIGIP